MGKARWLRPGILGLSGRPPGAGARSLGVHRAPRLRLGWRVGFREGGLRGASIRWLQGRAGPGFGRPMPRGRKGVGHGGHGEPGPWALGAALGVGHRGCARRPRAGQDNGCAWARGGGSARGSSSRPLLPGPLTTACPTASTISSGAMVFLCAPGGPPFTLAFLGRVPSIARAARVAWLGALGARGG